MFLQFWVMVVKGLFDFCIMVFILYGIIALMLGLEIYNIFEII